MFQFAKFEKSKERRLATELGYSFPIGDPWITDGILLPPTVVLELIVAQQELLEENNPSESAQGDAAASAMGGGRGRGRGRGMRRR